MDRIKSLFKLRIKLIKSAIVLMILTVSYSSYAQNVADSRKSTFLIIPNESLLNNSYIFGLSFFGYLSAANVYGINFGVPTTGYLTKNSYGMDFSLLADGSENVYGLQLAPIFNNSQTIYGLQISLVNLGNDARGIQFGVVNFTKHDSSYAYQMGVVNSSGDNNSGIQFGIFNTVVTTLKGVQAGIVNGAHTTNGIQFGLFNMTYNGSNFQLGLLNYNSKAWMPYFPIFNFSVE